MPFLFRFVHTLAVQCVALAGSFNQAVELAMLLGAALQAHLRSGTDWIQDCTLVFIRTGANCRSVLLELSLLSQNRESRWCDGG